MTRRTLVDADAQPINRRFNAARLSDRAIDELVGVCRGMTFDARVTEDEAKSLLGWLECNREYADRWPADLIYFRLREMLSDGVLDDQEQAELLDLMRDLTGGELPIKERVASYTSLLPLDRPLPPVRFSGRGFCMTGKFVYGSRKQCHAVVAGLGGIVHAAPAGGTSYLVVGAIGSRDWIHSTHGRKIEAAVALRAKHKQLAIVSEEHWTLHLGQHDVERGESGCEAKR